MRAGETAGRESAWDQRAPPVSFLVTAAAAAAHAATAGGGFAGKVNVLGQREREGIAVRAHGVIGERGAFPRLHARRGGGAAGGEERGGGEEQGEKAREREREREGEAGGAHSFF